MKADFCYAYICIAREKYVDLDQWLDRGKRLYALRERMAAAFGMPESRLWKILAEVDFSSVTAEELVRIIKKG